MTSTWTRRALLFGVLSALSALAWLAGRHDWLSGPVDAVALPLLLPGWLLRGLASGSELGFTDWRDSVIMIFGPAAIYTLAAVGFGWLRRRVNKL